MPMDRSRRRGAATAVVVALAATVALAPVAAGAQETRPGACAAERHTAGAASAGSRGGGGRGRTPSPATGVAPLAAGYWTRGLLGGWGNAWKHGVPGYGETESDIRFGVFHPQLGRFVTDRLELFGEGTLFVYERPAPALSAGVAGLGGRWHLRPDRRWTPYVLGIAGLLWTSLDVPEIDRVFNFQLVYGVGVRLVPPRGPGLMVELRNHHISNAGTAGENLGVNAAVVMAGVQWVLR